MHAATHATMHTATHVPMLCTKAHVLPHAATRTTTHTATHVPMYAILLTMLDTTRNVSLRARQTQAKGNHRMGLQLLLGVFAKESADCKG